LNYNTGSNNTAIGAEVLFSNTTGIDNNALGFQALLNNTAGSENIVLGTNAANAAKGGGGQLTQIDNSIFIGNNTVSAANGDDNEIVIGYNAVGNGSNTVTLGNDAVTATVLKGAVGIGTNLAQPSAALDIQAANKGMLFPRVPLAGTTDASTIASPAAYLTVFNTATTADVTPGLYYWDGTKWVSVGGAGAASSSWSLTGNAGTTAGTHFIGTTDNVDVVFKRNGVLAGLLTGPFPGGGNTTFGVNAFNLASTGFSNTAFGNDALVNNTTGYANTAIGLFALYSNTTGFINIALGANALDGNTTGSYNMALGVGALQMNTDGEDNVAVGANSLARSTGSNNTAIGAEALSWNITGIDNNALGFQALLNNNTGSENIVLGTNAANVDFSSSPITQIDNSILIGNNTKPGSNGDYNEVVIGDGAVGNGSNTVTLGNTLVTDIGGQVAWTNRSDKRIKEHLKENVPGLDFITKLKPISYNFNLEKQDSITGAKADTSAAAVASRKKAEAIIHTGFAAQDVETALKSLGYDFDGLVKPKNPTDLYSLSYSLFTVPLVKAVQEQQITITAQQKQIQAQQQQIDELRKMVEALAKKK